MLKKKLSVLLCFLMVFQILIIPQAVFAAETPGTNGTLAVNGQLSEVFFDTEKPVVYTIDKTNSKVMSINYENGQVIEKSTYYTPNSIAYFNNEVLVGFGQQGMIQIFDSASLELKDQIFTGCTFFDMNVDRSGYIYTCSSDYTRSFSRVSKQELSSLYVFEKGYLELHPTMDRFYFTSLSVSPMDIFSCSFSEGKLTEYHNSPYHGDYPMGERNRFSPDGNYIFNSAGNIYTTNNDDSKELKFYFKLNKAFKDVVFDTTYNRFFTYVGNKLIYAYDYNTFIETDTLSSSGDIENMVFKDNKIIAVSKNDNSYFIESIDVKAPHSPTPVPTISTATSTTNINNTDTPTSTPTTVPTYTPDPSTTATSTSVPLKYSFNSIPMGRAAEAVLHPDKKLLYILDDENNKLNLFNLETQVNTELVLPYTPTCLSILNNEVLIGFGSISTIMIYNAETLSYVDKIMVDTTFSDMETGADGNIYVVTYEYLKSYSRRSKQLISQTFSLYDAGYLEKHPTRNSFYTSSIGISPSDIFVYNYDNGNFTGKYDSRYHGDYDISPKNRISPDGKFIFNSSGNIFASGASASYDLIYNRSISSFTDCCFNLTNNRVYLSQNNSSVLKAMDYNSLTTIGNYNLKVTPQILLYKNNAVVSVSNEGIEIVPESDIPVSIPSPTPKPEEIMLSANAVISDTVMDPVKPIMYAVDGANSKVYSINLETSVIMEASIAVPPERIAYSNGELYVTLLKGRHGGSEQKGAVAILNAETMKVVEQFDVMIDPFDIVVKDGIVYIPSGSGQWTEFQSYSKLSKQLISSSSIRTMSYAELNPVNNKIYTITTDTFPRNCSAYSFTNGKFDTFYDSPYHGDYSMNTNFRISPDGKYIFNGSGLILNCDTDKSSDMNFKLMLNKQFNDVAFDLSNNRFYTFVGDKQIYVYDYKSLTETDVIYSKGNVLNMYCYGGDIYALSKSDNNTLMIEKVLTGINKSITGYIAPDIGSPSVDQSKLNSGFRVEVAGTGKYAVTDNKGHFEISGVPSGNYNLRITKNNYLTRELKNIPVNDNLVLSIDSAPILIWPGDVCIDGKQDNAINIADVIEVAKHFNTNKGSTNYSEGCDFNCDDAVNLRDIMILASHFNSSSESYPAFPLTVEPTPSMPV